MTADNAVIIKLMAVILSVPSHRRSLADNAVVGSKPVNAIRVKLSSRAHS